MKLKTRVCDMMIKICYRAKVTSLKFSFQKKGMVYMSVINELLLLVGWLDWESTSGLAII